MAKTVGNFHQFEFFGFKFIDECLVVDDFVAEFGEFVVLFGFELLGLESFDGGAACSNLEFDVFDGDFVGLVGGFGVGEFFLIAGEAGFGFFLELGDSGEVGVDGVDELIEVLKLEKVPNVVVHDLIETFFGEMGKGKDGNLGGIF